MSGHADAANRAVLIVDDDEDVTALLEALVGSRRGYRVVGALAEPEAGEAAVTELRPDIVVIGSHRETFDPLTLVSRIHSAYDEACVVLLADLPDPITLLDALGRGAATVLGSGAGWAELMPALDLLVAPRETERAVG